ncbi:hypothetical protein MTO96_036313 [Rhipicephalus appendiculatus]
MGRRCSSRKSELLIYHPPRRGRPSKDWRRPFPPCTLLHDSDGNRIPTVDKIRILGLIIQSNGSNLVMLESITFKIGNALPIVDIWKEKKTCNLKVILVGLTIFGLIVAESGAMPASTSAQEAEARAEFRVCRASRAKQRRRGAHQRGMHGIPVWLAS